METIKSKFIQGKQISAFDFMRLSAAVDHKIQANILRQIDNKVDDIQIIHPNGASRIGCYGLRSNSILAIARNVREVYNKLKTNIIFPNQGTEVEYDLVSSNID